MCALDWFTAGMLIGLVLIAIAVIVELRFRNL